MNKLLPSGRWESHPWARTGMVRHCPLWLLEIIANKKTTQYADLLSGEIVHQDKVWENIRRVGMSEPLLITITRSQKKIRLETGNHRIRTAIQDGLTHMPVAVQVVDRGWLSQNDHSTIADKLVRWDRIRPCQYPMQVDPIDVINFEGFKRAAPQGTFFRDFVI
jgi:hypothetical protein